MKLTKEEIFNTNDPMIEKITEKHGEKLGRYYKYSNILLRGFVLSIIIGIVFFIISIVTSFISLFSAFTGITELFDILTFLMMIFSFLSFGFLMLCYLIGLIYCLIMAYISYKLEEKHWSVIFLLGGILCIIISFICPISILLLVVLDIFYKDDLKNQL